MDKLLAIDVGTSSTRAIVYDLQFNILAQAQLPINLCCPQIDWVELCPEELWNKTLQVLQEAVKTAPGRILACGVTNQRETTLLWDKKTGKCLANAIVWQDRRTQVFCQKLKKYAQYIHKKTGLLPDAYFSASKINWLFQNIPEAAAMAQQNRLAFGTVDTFIIWRLTQGKSHVTDITNASRTLLFNIHTQQWDYDLLELFGIPENILPEVKDCDGSFGEIHSDYLPGCVPICGVAGDQQAALIGQACFKTGMAKTTLGTGGFFVLNTGDKALYSPKGLLTTIAYRIKNQIAYALEGGIFHVGTIVKWLRDQMHLIQRADQTEALANSLSSNEGVYLVPAFTGLGAPYWIDTDGAMMVGLTTSTTPAHFARAALESVAYQLRDILHCIRIMGVDVQLMRVDGGMAANAWLLQFLASQCQVTVQRPANVEMTALGVAILASLGRNLYGSTEDIESYCQTQSVFYPERDAEKMEQAYQGWQRALAKLTS